MIRIRWEQLGCSKRGTSNIAQAGDSIRDGVLVANLSAESTRVSFFYQTLLG
jgi:hypothetical protein